MKRTVLSILLGAAALLTAPQALAQETDKWAEHRGDLPFVLTYEKGREEAKFTGKPIMLFSTATW